MVAMMMIAIAGVGGGYFDVDGDDGRDSDDDIGIACTYNGSLRFWETSLDNHFEQRFRNHKNNSENHFLLFCVCTCLNLVSFEYDHF